MHLEKPVGESVGMDQLRRLRLDVRLPWPLTLIVQDTHLRQYNAIFVVLLQVLAPHSSQHRLCLSETPLPLGCKRSTFVQVHLAGKALNEVYSSACADSSRRGRGLDRAGALAMSMRCYLGAYLAHVMGHLVHSCTSNLQQVAV